MIRTPSVQSMKNHKIVKDVSHYSFKTKFEMVKTKTKKKKTDQFVNRQIIVDGMTVVEYLSMK